MPKSTIQRPSPKVLAKNIVKNVSSNEIISRDKTGGFGGVGTDRKLKRKFGAKR
jgi:hypothetical protein